MPDNLAATYYDLLGLTPTASVQQIRRAYRELSKLYHPDTTELPEAIATTKFQELNEAYATLSSPEKRVAYDLKLGYSRVSVIQAPPNLNRPASESRKFRSSAYLDPTDRPLSAGELFALFILGITFVGCLVLVIAVGITRGPGALEPLTALEKITPEAVEVVAPLAPPLQAPEPERDRFVTPIIPEPISSPDASLPISPQAERSPMLEEVPDTDSSEATSEPTSADVAPVE